MAKFRWDRAAIAAREAETLSRVKLDDEADRESDSAWLRRKRLERVRDRRAAAANLASLPKPLKPPSKRAEG